MVNDYLAYLGTTFIFGSTPIKRRFYSHLGRAFGSFLWLIYAIQLSSTPLIITETIAVIIDLVSAIRFKNV